MKDIELIKPIKSVNGVEIKAVHLDFDSVCAGDFRQIDEIAGKLRGKGSMDVDSLSVDTLLSTQGLDRPSCIALAWVAAMKGDASLGPWDVLQVGFRDAKALADAGFLFQTGVG